MARLIDKDVLIAEIEKRMQELYPTNTHKMQVGGMDRDVLMWLNALTWVKNFLDTLKVKEVDLEKEIDLVEDKYHGFESLSRADIIEIIKHFFDLGIKAQKG